MAGKAVAVKPTLFLPALLLMIATGASAQTAERPPAPLRIGPVDVYPTLALTNLGVDNNVFNGSPPDPGGIAGENHFVQTVNSAWMGIYRKSDLAQLRTTNL